jgi:hypothetical protein
MREETKRMDKKIKKVVLRERKKWKEKCFNWKIKQIMETNEKLIKVDWLKCIEGKISNQKK